MKNITITIIRGVIAIIAILNLVLLFGFSYQNPLEIIKEHSEPAGTGSTIASTNEEAVAATTEVEESVEEASTADSTIPAPEYKEKKCVVISKRNSRIRSGPGTDYERITSVPNGTVLTIIGEEEGWYNVRLKDGTEGYISKELVELIEN